MTKKKDSMTLIKLMLEAISVCDICNDSIADEMESKGFGVLVDLNRQYFDELKENLFTLSLSQDVIVQTCGKAHVRGSTTKH